MTQIEDVQDFINSLGDSEIFNTSDVEDRTGIPRASIRRVLSNLTRKEEIDRLEPGLFRVRRRGDEQVDDDVPREEQEIRGFYLSGLQYNRNIGVQIFTTSLDIEETERILRDYARENIQNFNEEFYGIAEIRDDGISPTNRIIKVNL